MALLQAEKQQTIKTYQRDKQDTGSPEVQVAVLTEEIQRLSGHLKDHPHDFHSQRGLMQKVGRRKRLLRYLMRDNPTTYQQLIQKLGIRGLAQ